MTCLDDETVLGLVEGRLEGGALAVIDHHLDLCASCRDVVTHVARSRTLVLERGTTIGRYVIGDLLGAGAMGRVYSAWEPELDRRVAIKVLQDDVAGARERLVREAQAMARLDHPNVVGVHEVAKSEHGVFVAMDLVDGETLRTWRHGSLPSMLADVARGLAAIHAAGVLHRDVKPDNVIVGADGRARIGDFGLARSGPPASVRPDDDALALGTPKTAVAGTPAYMAPEVLRGEPASAASDQFGFGVTAYEVIAGKRPFEGRTWSELLRAIERGGAAKLRDVPSWLDATVRRCLAVDPEKRFASMTDVATALDEGLRRRAPTKWIAAGVGLAIAASAVTYVATRSPAAGPSCDVSAIDETWNAQTRGKLDAPAIAAVDRWVAAWRTARSAVCTAPNATRERCLDRRRTELAALLAHGGSSERLVDALAALPPSECTTLALATADPLPLDPERAAQVRTVERELPAIRAAIALGDARPIAATLAKLVETARASTHAPTLGEALLVQSEAARSLSNLPEASMASRDALAAAERGHDDLGAARAWVERVTVAGDRRELAFADDFATLAEAAIDRAGGSPHLAARVMRMRGLVEFNRGDLARARDILTRARAMFVAVAGERSVEIAGVETSLGAVARASGDLDAAQRHHELALAIDRELRGESHPDIARDLHNLAGIARLRGRLDEALGLYHRALAIEDAIRGKASVQSALTQNSIGLVHMERHEWKQAAAALTIARDAFAAAGHGDIAFAEHNLGIVQFELRDYEAALAHFDAAAAHYARTIGSDAPGPKRLVADRQRARIALGGARVDPPAPGKRIEPTVVPPAPDKPIEPTVVPPAPVPQPPTPKPPEPKPIDVGVYGSSQGW